MRKKWLWVIAGVLAMTLLATLTIIYFSKTNFQNSPQEECKTLKYSSEGRVNILFFAEKKQAEEYSNFLLDIYPFNQSRDNFNIYYIDTYNPTCELYKGISILCHSKELIKKSSSCPSDYIIVLKDEKRQIRSSSYMNVLSLNLAHPLSVFAHEFAHSFASLADEYTPAKLPRGQENCKDDCTEFEGMGCFGGCSKDNFFRSFENGLMRTLSSKDYGPFDSLLISEKLGISPSSGITGKVVQDSRSCSTQKYYLVEGEYVSGEMKIKRQSIQVGCPGGNGQGEFEYKITMEDGTELSNGFNPEIIFTDNEEGGNAYEYSGNFYLKLPVMDTAISLEIRLENKILLKTNLVKEDSLPCQS